MESGVLKIRKSLSVQFHKINLKNKKASLSKSVVSC